MKSISTFFFLLFIVIKSYGQYNEFETHSNGLIYDHSTINQLKFIVDSLNLKFKACKISEAYYSKLQSKVIVVNSKSRNVYRDIKNGITLESLIKKYPKMDITNKRLVVVNKYKDNSDELITSFSTKSIKENYGKDITFQKNIDPIKEYSKGSWIHEDESSYAFYLLDNFKKEQLKDTYAHMVQYADCMIDTTSSKIMENADYGYVKMPKNYRNLSKKKKEKLLKNMRNTRVIGTCSMDDSPRIHAVNIAKLSAETINWAVFLKAHLDIMNDRFERTSDGSYAQAGRKTYLKELEVLDIDIKSLLFGISLRIDNAHKNHYYGYINRLGRALSDVKNNLEIENALLGIIKDEELDDYNRYLMYFLYENYLYYSNVENEDKSKIISKLNLIQEKLPNYLIGSD